MNRPRRGSDKYWNTPSDFKWVLYEIDLEAYCDELESTIIGLEAGIEEDSYQK